MAKQKLLLAFSFNLLLKLVASTSQHQSPNLIVNEDLSLKEIKSHKPLEEYLASELLPLLVYTAILVEERSRYVISASNIFLKQVVRALFEFPMESELIHWNITRVNELVERIEDIDLEGDSSAVLAEKFTVLKDIELLLADMNFVTREDFAERDAIFAIKADLKDFHKNLLRSADIAVHKFSIIFARFWNALSETGKRHLLDISDWWMHFQAAKSSEKFKLFAKFFGIFKI